jgi:hypothetical protein
MNSSGERAVPGSGHESVPGRSGIVARAAIASAIARSGPGPPGVTSEPAARSSGGTAEPLGAGSGHGAAMYGTPAGGVGADARRRTRSRSYWARASSRRAWALSSLASARQSRATAKAAAMLSGSAPAARMPA